MDVLFGGDYGGLRGLLRNQGLPEAGGPFPEQRELSHHEDSCRVAAHQPNLVISYFYHIKPTFPTPSGGVVSSVLPLTPIVYPSLTDLSFCVLYYSSEGLSPTLPITNYHQSQARLQLQYSTKMAGEARVQVQTSCKPRSSQKPLLLLYSNPPPPPS